MCCFYRKDCHVPSAVLLHVWELLNDIQNQFFKSLEFVIGPVCPMCCTAENPLPSQTSLMIKSHILDLTVKELCTFSLWPPTLLQTRVTVQANLIVLLSSTAIHELSLPASFLSNSGFRYHRLEMLDVLVWHCPYSPCCTCCL